MTKASWIIAALVALCFLALLPLESTATGLVRAAFGVHAAGVLNGRYWTFLTYQFLHGGWLHLAVNLVTLLSVGPEVERAVGSLRLAALYTLGGVAGAAVWLVTVWPLDTVLIGASASICGLLGALAALRPRERYALIFLPAPLPAWLIIAVLAATQAAHVMLFGTQGHVAYVAHLAGGFAGFAAALTLRRRSAVRRLAD